MGSIRFTAAFLVACGFLAGADVTSRDFYNSIRNNDLTRLNAMLAAGAPADLRDSRGVTPLMNAAAIGSLDAMKILLKAGADVNAKSGLDATALMWGASDPAKAKLLIGAGANVNARSKVGRTPLVIAAGTPGAAPTVRLLLAKGADPSVVAARGYTPLNQAGHANDIEILRALLPYKANLNTGDFVGLSALMYAAGRDNLPAVRLLLKAGADVNAANVTEVRMKNGLIALSKLTALMTAAPASSPEVVQALLDAGADANARDVRGLTPLMQAVASDVSDPRVVRLLLSRGADPALKSTTGETAADWARKFALAENLRLLDAAPAESKPAVRPAGLEKKNLRRAVESAVALLQSSTGEYFKQSGCVGCHHQNLAGAAVAQARKNGFHIDETADAEHRHVTTVNLASDRPAMLEGLFISVDALSYMLFQMSQQGYPADENTDATVALIASQQTPDGNWLGFPIVRPPLEDREIVRTALAVRALREYAIPARKADFDARIAKARRWLEQTEARLPHERSFRLLGLVWSGADRGRIDSAAAAVRADQREDGGWPQLSTLASDAYATGVALYALRQAGLAADDAIYDRGAGFLLSTQLPGGSWHVASRAPKLQPYFQSGFPHDHDQWISAAATAWAVTALSETGVKERRSASLR